MAFVYFNQRDYIDVYSASSPPNTALTIKTSGCGPTSIAMIVSNLSGQVVTPPQMAIYAIQNGYRFDGAGTDLVLMSPAIASKYNLHFSQTNDISVVVKHLGAGGMAIANVAGGKTGLFSTGGHFIVLAGLALPYIIVLDPYMYQGKFSLPHRKGKVLADGNELRTLPEYLDADTRHDYKAYYLFSLPNPSEITPNQEITDYKNIIQAHCRFSDPTKIWELTDRHMDTFSLYKKWAESYLLCDE